MGVRFGIGFVCLWVGKYVIMPCNYRDGVSVGSHGFEAKSGLIIGHIGSLFIYFFYVAFFGYVWYHGLFASCLGWCRCWTFFCHKYLY